MSLPSPFDAFNFLVNLDGIVMAIGAFSEASGLNAETDVTDYREGDEKGKPVGKISHPRKPPIVTLKRGVVASDQWFAWIRQAARRDLVVTLRDEKGAPVRRWILHRARPDKWTGPTLSAKGGDVAMEELVLTGEGLSVG